MRRPRGPLRLATSLFVPLLLVSCDSSPLPTVRVRDGAAMGTIVEMKVVAADEAAAERAFDAAFAEITRAEAVATPYDPASELARANARADSTFIAGPELDAMLDEACRVAAASDGAFDPTIAPLVEIWGFPEAPALPDSAHVAEARARVDWRALHRTDGGGGSANEDGGTVGPGDAVAPGAHRWALADPLARLDLGGIAKGWAVDRAADVLEAAGGACLVNAGGDLAARGTKPGGEPWVVGIQHPRDPSSLVLRLRVPPGRAVATSGDYERFFEEDGVRYHHLLDPATGYPARGTVSATVVAPSCALADAWATAVFVLGPAEGLRRLEAARDLEGVVIEVDETGALVLHETTGFAALRLP